MFEEALAELSGMPLARVSALVHDNTSTGFHALFRRAGLPISTYPAFREAVEALREGGFDPGGTIRLKRRMVERVLTRCADETDVDIEPLLTLLRRFAAEAAREEARMFCEELVGDDGIEPEYEQRQAA
jgi:CBS-domain-containing membrane protein